MDNHKILKALVAVVMIAVIVVLVLITVSHVRTGLDSSNSKLMLALYVAMICYAAYRAFVCIKEIVRR